MDWEVTPLVDTGRTEEIYVSGLAEVERIDDHMARLAWHVNRSQEGERTRLVKVALFIPVVSVGLAFDLCIVKLGSRMMRSETHRLLV